MKGAIRRTKVVIRHLPPTISQSSLTDQIDGHFAGRYSWLSFRHGNNKKKRLSYSRGYIVFKGPEDVLEFVQFFESHVFVNEKGSQFKTIVEYAPSQRVPREFSKKDGREGTINKDPEYMEFFEFISKPAKRLPSAEIQLERREASGSVKDALIVTPLMEFVRQKRAARSLPSMKPSMKSRKATCGKPGSVSSKQYAEKRRKSTTMYVLGNTTNVKEESTIIMVPKQVDRQLSGSASISTETFSDVVGKTGTYCGKPMVFFAKNEILILSAPFKFTLIGKFSHGRPSLPEIEVSFEAFVPRSSFSIGLLDNRHVLIRFNNENDYHRFWVLEQWLLKKFQMMIFKWSPDFRIDAESSSYAVSGCLSKQNTATSTKNLAGSAILKPNQQCKGSGRIINSILNKNTHQTPSSSSSVVHSEKQIQPLIPGKDKGPHRPPNLELLHKDNNIDDKRTRNKDRPDRFIWTPIRRLLGSHATQLKQSHLNSGEGSHVHDLKNADSHSRLNKGKPLKKGGSSGNGVHEVRCNNLGNKYGLKSQVCVHRVVVIAGTEI